MSKTKAAAKNDIEDKEYSRRELLQMVVPKAIFPNKGRLTIDKEKCSGCALCAQECLTGALTVEGDESISLVFHAQKCDFCGECIEICPEKCLYIETGKNTLSPEILFEDEFARCTKCGVVIGSKAMIGKIESKFESSNQKTIANLYRCPACKGG